MADIDEEGMGGQEKADMDGATEVKGCDGLGDEREEGGGETHMNRADEFDGRDGLGDERKVAEVEM
jgi:hypothetical protein